MYVPIYGVLLYTKADFLHWFLSRSSCHVISPTNYLIWYTSRENLQKQVIAGGLHLFGNSAKFNKIIIG